MSGKNIEGFEIKVFEKESVTDEIVTKYFSLINSIWKEMHPLEPLPSIEGMKQHFFEPIPNKQSFSWLSFKDNEIVGSCDLLIEDNNSPFYNERKNQGQFWMNVLKKHRRKGLGTEMLKTIVEKTSEFDNLEFLELTGATPLKESIAFCENFGGEVIYEAEENRAYIRDINWSKIEQMKNEAYKEMDNISIQIFEKIPDFIIQDYAKAFTEIRNESSFQETPIEKRITPEKLRNHEEILNKDEIKWIHFIIKNNDGEIIAIGDLRYHLDALERINEAFAGFRVTYQKTKIKEILKSEMLLYIKNNFPRVNIIYIWFEHPIMNTINKEIGFTKHYQGKNFKFNLNELEKQLEDM